MRPRLEKLCMDMEIQGHVKFLGFSKNPYKLMLDADLLVLSSDWEGLPTVIIEALYCGLPIVSTDCPSGPREILINGAYGSLVPMNDKSALANAIVHELTNRRFPEVQMAAASRFLPSEIAKQFLQLMR